MHRLATRPITHRATAVLTAAACTFAAAIASAPAAQAAEPFSDYIELSAAAVDMGDLQFGGPTASQTYTLTALQNVTLSVTSWPSTPLNGTNMWHADASGACAGLVGTTTSIDLTTGDVCSVTVEFDPNTALTPSGAFSTIQTFNASSPSAAIDSVDVMYSAMVEALSWVPNSLTFYGQPGVTTAAQTVTVTNEAAAAIDSLSLASVPPDFTADLSGCAIPLPVGGTCPIAITYTPNAADPIVDASVGIAFSATGTDGPRTWDGTSPSFGLRGITITGSANLAVTKEPGTTAAPVPGETFPWTVTVTQNGPNLAPMVTVTDTLDEYSTFDHADNATCTDEAAGVSCTLGLMPPGASATFTVWSRTAANLPAGTALVNSVDVSSLAPDSVTTNNQAVATSAPSPAADVSLTMTPDANAPVLGGTTTWRLTATNAGPEPATSTVITDTLPSDLTFVSGPSECTATGAVVTCQLGDLAAGDTWTGNLVTQLGSGLGVGTTVTNTAAITSAVPDPNNSNNTVSATSLPMVAPGTTGSPTPGAATSGGSGLASSGAGGIASLTLSAAALLAIAATILIRRRTHRTS